ncbi:MAG: Hsp20/alpha crystallin family protein [Oligoflexia bacterium]|nr:Hsp20/alpha crystallin family protein [Oligoflexia bacterium]
MKWLMNPMENKAWSLFPEMGESIREADRLFREFLPRSLETRTFMSPSCDIEETEKTYAFKFDIPGLRREDLKVEILDNQLVVSGERKTEKKHEDSVTHYTERFSGKFQRVFRLPANARPQNITAHYREGVLEIAVPKDTVATARQIEVAYEPSKSESMGKTDGDRTSRHSVKVAQ